jgi:hypothetical protein
VFLGIGVRAGITSADFSNRLAGEAAGLSEAGGRQSDKRGVLTRLKIALLETFEDHLVRRHDGSARTDERGADRLGRVAD